MGVATGGWAIAGSLCGTARGENGPSDQLDAYAGRTITVITFSGHRVTRTSVIAREVWSEEGQPLEPELVRQDITRLDNLSIFGSVSAGVTPADGGVALDYQFSELPWLIPYPALGYTEQNGFSIGVGVASVNLLGRDMTMSADAMFGGTTTFSLIAENPWITGNHVSAGFMVWHDVRDNTLLDFRQTTDRLGLSSGTYLGERGRLAATLGYYGVKSDEDSITIAPDNRDHLFDIEVVLGYDSRDSWRVPHEGWETSLIPGYIGGDANTWTLQLDVRRYQPLGLRHTIATGPLLSLQSGAVGAEIPSYYQYFLGGANSIRGYNLEELGPELFGRHQFLYTLEYRYLLGRVRGYKLMRWTVGLGFELAAFGDFGIAWSESREVSLDRARAGFGAGFRVLAPSVGSVRLDLGVSQNGDFVFNFGVGSIFDARRMRVR